MKLERASTRSEGSLWELCLFAIFFVIVFSAIARADNRKVAAASNSASKSASNFAAKKSPKRLAKQSPKSGFKFSAATTTPKAKSSNAKRTTAKTVAQNDSVQVTQNSQPVNPPGPTTANPATETPIRAKQQQLAPVPTGALPAGTVGATLTEPKLHGPRFTTSGKFLIETTATVSSEDPRSYGGWYQLAYSVSDSQSDMSLGILAGYSREYSYQRDDNTDGDFDNPIISINKKWKNGVHFRSPIFDTLTLGLASSLGVGREARRRTFQGSIGPSFSMSKDIRKLSVGLGVGYNRGFYEYDIRDDGTVNSPDQFIGSAGLSYAVTDKLSASVSMLYTYGISFQGVGKANELSALSLDYNFSKKFAVSVGAATQRGTLEADGRANTVKIFDPNVAQAFLDLNFIL